MRKGGKWGPKELAYKDHLVSAFENRFLDLEKGDTLVEFLSKALNCKEMRISKKFTGSEAIGRVFYKRFDAKNATPAQLAEKAAVRAKLQALEAAFLLEVEAAKDGRAAGAGGIKPDGTENASSNSGESFASVVEEKPLVVENTSSAPPPETQGASSQNRKEAEPVKKTLSTSSSGMKWAELSAGTEAGGGSIDMVEEDIQKKARRSSTTTATKKICEMATSTRRKMEGWLPAYYKFGLEQLDDPKVACLEDETEQWAYIGGMWRDLDNQEKARYNSEAQEKKESFFEDFVAHNAKCQCLQGLKLDELKTGFKEIDDWVKFHMGKKTDPLKEVDTTGGSSGDTGCEEDEMDKEEMLGAEIGMYDGEAAVESVMKDVETGAEKETKKQKKRSEREANTDESQSESGSEWEGSGAKKSTNKKSKKEEPVSKKRNVEEEPATSSKAKGKERAGVETFAEEIAVGEDAPPKKKGKKDSDKGEKAEKSEKSDQNPKKSGEKSESERGEKKSKKIPTDDEIRDKVKEVCAGDWDEEVTTRKQLRKEVEACFPDVDLSEKKETIRTMIKEVMSG